MTSITPRLKERLDRLSPNEKIEYLKKQIEDYKKHMNTVYDNVEKMLRKIKEAREDNNVTEVKKIEQEASRAIDFAQPYKEHLKLLESKLEEESTKLTHSWLDNARPVPKTITKTMGRGLKKTRKRKKGKKTRKGKKQKRRKTRK
tara:strand:- start:418 stop:852 length:435 start_codon:yes stop_codon:yes gene_type:complete